MVRYWPQREIVAAIPSQAEKLTGLIRDLLPTTDPKGPRGGIFARSTDPLPQLYVELDKLTYLFYGRTLDDFENDWQTTRKLRCPILLTRWIVAFPTLQEMEVEKKLLTGDGIRILMPDCRGWPIPVGNYLDSLFSALATLRIYFGQGPVFARNGYIRAGAWLRDHYAPYPLHPPPDTLPWFACEFCREPMFGLKSPPLFLTPVEMDTPPRIPDEITRCGTHEVPRTQGLPVEWLDSIEFFAEKLRQAIQGTIGSGEMGVSLSKISRATDGERCLLKPYPESPETTATEEALRTARVNSEKLAHRLQTARFHLQFLLNCADPTDPIRFSAEANDLQTIAGAWNKCIAEIGTLALVNRKVEVVIERACANLPAVSITFPTYNEVGLWVPFQKAEDGKSFIACNKIRVRQGEQFIAGVHLTPIEAPGEPFPDLRPSNFQYATAHEALAMAGRHLTTLLELTEELAASALGDDWIRERFRAILDNWFDGLEAARARLSAEHELASRWMNENQKKVAMIEQVQPRSPALPSLTEFVDQLDTTFSDPAKLDWLRNQIRPWITSVATKGADGEFPKVEKPLPPRATDALDIPAQCAALATIHDELFKGPRFFSVHDAEPDEDRETAMPKLLQGMMWEGMIRRVRDNDPSKWIVELRAMLRRVEAAWLEAAQKTLPQAGQVKTSKGNRKAKELTELEKATPSLDRDSGCWVSTKRAAKIEGLETATLASYRNKGLKNQDKTLGRDKDGRVWRRDGTPNSHPMYLRISLVAERTVTTTKIP